MSNYTDEQIRQAILDMPMHEVRAPASGWEVEMFKQFLDALPDHADDWQECEFSEIRKGDRVKYENKSRIVEPKGRVSKTTQSELWVDSRLTLYSGPEYKFWRIPDPIQHPDPAEHHLIGSVEYYDADDPDYAELGNANGGDYMLFNNGVFEATVSPEEILSWVPVRVIADD